MIPIPNRDLRRLLLNLESALTAGRGRGIPKRHHPLTRHVKMLEFPHECAGTRHFRAMSISRNDLCPCGSGKKYKKCCLSARAGSRSPSPKFRFEHGSYGGPGRGFIPSAICYAQVRPGEWSEHFCLVNPTCCFDNEIDASETAEADLNEAFAVKNRTGSDSEFALCLKRKGYFKADGFRRARD
jgi:hypothetical protein